MTLFDSNMRVGFFEEVFDEMTLSGILTLIYTICYQGLHDENLVNFES